MTLATTQNKITYSTNGSATAFPFPYRLLRTADLRAYLTNSTGAVTELALNTDYTVALAGDGTAVATTASAYAVGNQLTLIRQLVIDQQQLDLLPNGKIPAEAIEAMFDRAAMIAQQQQEELDRSIKAPNSETIGGTLPGASSRAGKLLGFDVNGNLTVQLPAAESASASAVAANASRLAAGASEVNAATSAANALQSEINAADSEGVAENAAAIAVATLESINAVKDEVQINAAHLELGRRVGDPGVSLVYGRRI